MRTYTVNDLDKFGIGFLTRESCAIGLRGLYDLTEEGLGHIEKAFTIRIDRDKTPKNWNSSVNGVPAIASIKLSWYQAHDLLIAILAMEFDVVAVLHPKNNDKYTEVGIVVAGSWDNWNEYNDDIIDRLYNYRLYYQDHPNNRNLLSQPHIGLDNIHRFSGRTS